MRFKFSGTLLRFVDFQRELALEAPTVAAALALLVQTHPGLKSVLYDGAGKVRPTHRLFLNGEQLLGSDLEKPLVATDTVEVLTAIAGG